MHATRARTARPGTAESLHCDRRRSRPTHTRCAARADAGTRSDRLRYPTSCPWASDTAITAISAIDAICSVTPGSAGWDDDLGCHLAPADGPGHHPPQAQPHPSRWSSQSRPVTDGKYCAPATR